MPPLQLPEELVRMAANKVAAYIAEQRTFFRGKAAAILPEDRMALRPFFPANLVDEVRVVHGQAPEPSFYPQLRSLGFRDAPSFADLAGITFLDVVVHTETLTRSVLFHELVHAVQYRHLGVAGFAELYVRGFVTGGSYEEIPLEKQAYELEGRFAQGGEIFSVAEEVQRRRKARKL